MKITYDNREFDIEENTTIGEAFKKEIENSKLKDIIAARFNNTIESLNLPIKKDGEIEFINREDKDGRIIYIRGLLFIMSMAFSEVYPKALLTVNYQLSNAMFSSVDNMEVTDEMIKKVKQRMQEIIDEDIPIRKIMIVIFTKI